MFCRKELKLLISSTICLFVETFSTFEDKLVTPEAFEVKLYEQFSSLSSLLLLLLRKLELKVEKANPWVTGGVTFVTENPHDFTAAVLAVPAAIEL